MNRAFLTFPFAAKQIPLGDKGKAGMGMGILTSRRAILTFPFQGKAGMGMGYF